MSCVIGILGVILICVGVYGICKKYSVQYAVILLLGVFVFVGYGMQIDEPIQSHINATDSSYESSNQDDYCPYCGS